MDRKFYFFLIVILIVIILLQFQKFLQSKITGFFANKIQINVSKIVRGKLTLSYFSTINFSQVQDILVEFKNTGSAPVTEKIEVTVYTLSGSKLQPVAYYYDSYVALNPGMRRSFENMFIAPYPGLFYIKAKAYYESKIAETWGAFLVLYYLPPPTITTTTTTAPPAITPPPVEVGIPKITLEYPEEVTIKQNHSSMVNILVKNTGNVTINDLKFYISTTNLLDVDVSPKQIFILPPNDSAIFLLSIWVPEDTPVGIYPISFEIMSDKITESGSIRVNVSKFVSLKDIANKTIKKYEYLISQIEQEVYDAKERGLNVDLALKSLEKAKNDLYIAKEYYKMGEYENSMIKLKDVEDDLKDTVFQLANASIPVTIVVPAYRPLIVLVIAILVAMIFVVILFLKRKRKKKEEKPRLLRAAGEE